MTAEERVPVALLLLRLGVFVVMFMWTLDKFLNTKHAVQVFAKFYFMSGLSDGAFYAIGLAELVVLFGFLLGYQKRFTYGGVLVFHAISTVSSFRQYLDPFKNLLFFAAWPMLAACSALYLLRDRDTKWALTDRS